MSDNDTHRGNGWHAVEDLVLEDIRRIKDKVDRLDAKFEALIGQTAESRGRVKVWEAFVLGLIMAGAGVVFGRVVPPRDDAQVQSLIDTVRTLQREVEYIKAGDKR